MLYPMILIWCHKSWYSFLKIRSNLKSWFKASLEVHLFGDRWSSCEMCTRVHPMFYNSSIWLTLPKNFILISVSALIFCNIGFLYSCTFLLDFCTYTLFYLLNIFVTTSGKNKCVYASSISPYTIIIFT